MFLIDDLLFLPIKGFFGIFEKIHDMAMEEFEDTPEKLQRELLDLQMRFEMEEISEEEHKKKEDETLARLEALRKEETIIKS